MIFFYSAKNTDVASTLQRLHMFQNVYELIARTDNRYYDTLSYITC